MIKREYKFEKNNPYWFFVLWIFDFRFVFVTQLLQSNLVVKCKIVNKIDMNIIVRSSESTSIRISNLGNFKVDVSSKKKILKT